MAFKHLPDQEAFTALKEQWVHALNEEKNAQKEHGGRSYHVTDGIRLQSKAGEYIYLFWLDADVNLPVGTSIRLELDSSTHPIFGEIVFVNGFEIVLLLQMDLGPECQAAQLFCEPWMLLDALMERLDSLDDEGAFQLKLPLLLSDAIAHPLSSDQQIEELIHSDSQGLVEKQQVMALEHSLANPVTLIWGPPGTGKTTALGRIATRHFYQSKDILILSYSNVAVDGAILKVDDRVGTLNRGKVLRYGYPKLPEMQKSEHLLSRNIALDRLGYLDDVRDLEEWERRLRKQLDKGEEQDKDRFIQVAKEHHRVREQIRDKERKIIEGARILGTTLSKAALDPAVYSKSYDLVLVDEASMVYIPYIIFAASLATKHLVISGDFRQLPPIARSDSPAVRDWIKRDIFDVLGIIEEVDQGKRHPWLVPLLEQNRMHPTVAKFCSDELYGSVLVSPDGMEKRRQWYVEHQPFKTQTMGLYDVTDAGALCYWEKGSYSRFNILSALFMVSLTRDIITDWRGNKPADEDFSIGLMTPYQAQARLLWAMVRDPFFDLLESRGAGRPRLIVASTVHQFQGSERSVILFDYVDSLPRRKPSVLLRSNEHHADRLANVAITRSKGVFAALAHLKFLQEGPLHQIHHHLFQYMQQNPESCVEPVGNLVERHAGKTQQQEQSALPKETPKYTYAFPIKWYKAQEYETQWLEDINRSQKEIILALPSYTKPECEAIQKLINIRRKQTKNGNQVKWTICCRDNDKEYFRDLISNVEITKGQVLAPLTFIDGEIFWYGVPYVKPPSHYEDQASLGFPRYEGKYATARLLSLLNIKQAKDIAISHKLNLEEEFNQFIAQYYKCKQCGAGLVLRFNKQGKAFLGCPNYPKKCSGETQPLDRKLLTTFLSNHSIKCPKCGALLKGRVNYKTGKVFLGCGDFPDCKYSGSLQQILG